MKKRRAKLRPLPPELASAAKRKALFASLMQGEGTPHQFLQINSYPWQKPNAANGLAAKSENDAGRQSKVGVAAALSTRQQKRGAPRGNRNALRHGRFSAKSLAMRAQIRRIVAEADKAIALVLAPLSATGAVKKAE